MRLAHCVELGRRPGRGSGSLEGDGRPYIGPENDAHIERVLKECRTRRGIAVVGWGNHGSFMQRDKVAIRIAAEVGVVFHCVA